MTHYFAEYSLFLAEILTVIIGILILFSGLMALKKKGRPSEKISIVKLNEKYEDIEENISKAVLNKKELKALHKNKKCQNKENKSSTHLKKKIFVLRFNGDLKASAVENLREEISSVLLIAKTTDEILLLLESPGGMVHSYGLAASQLERIRQHNIPLTIAIDKVAASGGYLMACVANKIIAAPFAIIGSIGVLAQLPNFNRLLKKHGVDYEQITAGQYKRTITMFGENTDEDRAKMKLDLESIHHHFKEFIKTYRETVNLEQVATGEHWLAKEAQTLNLVDHLQTSDDYLLNAYHDCDIYEIHYEVPKSLSEKLIAKALATLAHLGL